MASNIGGHGALRENSSVAKVLYALESFLYKKAEKVIFPMLGGVEYAIGRGLVVTKLFGYHRE